MSRISELLGLINEGNDGKGACELAYRIPGAGGWKRKSFKSKEDQTKFIDKLVAKEGEDFVEFKFAEKLEDVNENRGKFIKSDVISKRRITTEIKIPVIAEVLVESNVYENESTKNIEISYKTSDLEEAIRNELMKELKKAVDKDSEFLFNKKNIGGNVFINFPNIFLEK